MGAVSRSSVVRVPQRDVFEGLQAAQKCLQDGQCSAARDIAMKMASSVRSQEDARRLLLVLGWAALGDRDYSMACHVVYALAAGE
jgi:hypothetical protein